MIKNTISDFLNNYSIRKVGVFIFILSFLIRLTYGIVEFKRDRMEGYVDDKHYMGYAESVMEQGPIVLDISGILEDFVGPGLPWIMAAAMTIFGKSWLTLFILNAVIGGLTSFLVFFLGTKLFGKRVGFLAGIWSCFYVLFIFFIPTSGKEIWLTFLFLVNVILSINVIQDPIFRWKPILLWILVFSFLIHFDERYFAYFLFFNLSILLWNNSSLRIRLKRTVAFSSLVLILMVPWLIRNFIVYDKIIVLTTRTEHLTDKLFGYNENLDYVLDKSINKFNLTESQIDSVVVGTKTTFANGRKISGKQIEAMKHGILPHKFTKWESYQSIFRTLWKPLDFKEEYIEGGFKFNGKWNRMHNLSVGVTYGLMLLFSIVGFLQIFKNSRDRQILIFLFSILLFHSLVHVLFLTNTVNRYRIPIDPYIIIVGIYGILNVFNFEKSAKSSRKKTLTFSKILDN